MFLEKKLKTNQNINYMIANVENVLSVNMSWSSLSDKQEYELQLR